MRISKTNQNHSTQKIYISDSYPAELFIFFLIEKEEFLQQNHQGV
jgi:hypothetical protein